jgi:hypothetical protein
MSGFGEGVRDRADGGERLAAVGGAAVVSSNQAAGMT